MPTENYPCWDGSRSSAFRIQQKADVALQNLSLGRAKICECQVSLGVQVDTKLVSDEETSREVVRADNNTRVPQMPWNFRD